MSWDVMVFKYEGEPPTEPDDDRPSVPLGPADEVRAAIASALPEVDWSNPSWGIYEGPGFTFEFNVDENDPIESIMVHVRGGGDAIEALLRFSVPNGWSLMDCSSGDFIDPKNPSQESWEGFQELRDKALEEWGKEGEE